MTLSGVFGFGACIALIDLISYMNVDEFRVLKYLLQGEDDFSEYED